MIDFLQLRYGEKSKICIVKALSQIEIQTFTKLFQSEK